MKPPRSLAGAIVAALSIFLIPRQDIDGRLARGESAGTDGPVALTVLFKDRRILVFTASVVLFHFANAALLPLVGQKLAQGHGAEPALVLSVCIIVAQAVMMPVSLLAGELARRWGHKSKKAATMPLS